MRIVDTQCHVSTVWYEPVETLLAQMDRNGVEQAVLIQRLGEFDNTYQQECVRRYPHRFASVVMVEASVPIAVARGVLEAYAAEGAAGVRLRPDVRSPDDDPLAIWRCAADLGLPVSCVGSAEKFGEQAFFDLVAAVPDLTIVLEHLGATSRSLETTMAARKRVFELAEYPNVYLKVPGLGELVPRQGHEVNAAFIGAPAQRDLSETPLGATRHGTTHTPAARHTPGPPLMPWLIPPVPELELALSEFGPDRLMWGSDFPVVSSREGYANALVWTRDAIAAAMPHAVDSVFGGTARRVFRLI